MIVKETSRKHPVCVLVYSAMVAEECVFEMCSLELCSLEGVRLRSSWVMCWPLHGLLGSYSET